MKLEKAIKLGEDILRYVKPGDPPDEHDAIKLLIEAGKVVNRHSFKQRAWEDRLLPGETEE